MCKNFAASKLKWTKLVNPNPHKNDSTMLNNAWILKHKCSSTLQYTTLKSKIMARARHGPNDCSVAVSAVRCTALKLVTQHYGVRCTPQSNPQYILQHSPPPAPRVGIRSAPQPPAARRVAARRQGAPRLKVFFILFNFAEKARSRKTPPSMTFRLGENVCPHWMGGWDVRRHIPNFSFPPTLLGRPEVVKPLLPWLFAMGKISSPQIEAGGGATKIRRGRGHILGKIPQQKVNKARSSRTYERIVKNLRY